MKNSVEIYPFSNYMSLQKEVEKIEAAHVTIRKYLPRLSAPKLIRDSVFYFWGISLLLTFLCVHLSNFFFDLYYAVSDVPKYLKVSASQTALLVNFKINQKIVEEEKIRLTIIQPQGFKNGVESNFVEGLTNVLETRSSLLALKTNSRIGEIKTLPIQFTNSYQTGMQSAYETGKKYYDVNLEVAGSQNALIVGNSGNEECYEMNLFNASLGLIEQADQALRINLNHFLNHSGDREYSLRSYLNYLKNIEKSMQTTQNKVKKQVEDFLNKNSQTTAKMEQTESDFFTALNAFDQNETYTNLKEFVEDYKNKVDQKAHLQAMNQIDRYFTAYLPILMERIEAVESNREALVYGIRVVAFENVDLGLIVSR